MPTKLFITGITGYIGGDAFHTLQQQHPSFEFSALIRSEEKAKYVREIYPAVRVVLGGLDDAAVIEREAAWADIVIHTADSSDHVGAANAIAKGLIQGHSKERPGYWLHTGGTGILTYFDSEVKKVHGEPDDKVFNDYEGVSELVNLPDAAFHRNVDEIVLRTGREHGESVKTVIVCPPTIYGRGRGPVSLRGRQVYELAAFILQQGYTPVIGKGLARWNNVHVYDLSRLFGELVRVAVDPKGDDGEVWGEKGYLLCENGEHVWGDLARRVGEQAHKLGYLKKEPEVKELSLDEAIQSPAGFEAASWGWNSRGRALRGRKVLGWTPKERSIEDEVPDILKAEASRLGL
ncbi:nucleoside-diphosphate-sugar epimerase [Aspergillus californicus]